jgi:hypothetical protein
MLIVNMNANCSDIIERMKRVGRLKNDTAVARRLGITPQAVSNYRKRGRMPLGLVLRFAELYGLSVDWLLTGIGQMYSAKDSNKQRDVPASLTVDMAVDRTGGIEVDKSSAGLKPLSPDEMICVEKILKILRGSNKSVVDALKLSIDVLLKFAEPSKETGPDEGDG